MTRYLRQRDQYSCGPIALINAAKWAGLNITRRSLRTVIEMCGSTVSIGTHYAALTRVIREDMDGLFILSGTRRRPTATQIIEHLRHHDRALVLIYFHRTRAGSVVGHFTFMPGAIRDEDELLLVNAVRGQTTTVYDRAWLEGRLCLGRRSRFNYPQAWFLRRCP